VRPLSLWLAVGYLYLVSSVHADQVSFSYSTSLYLPKGWLSVMGDGPISLSGGLSGDGNTVTIDHVTGIVQFRQTAGGTHEVTPGDGLTDLGIPAVIPLGHFSAVSNPNGQNGDFFFGGAFGLNLFLNDLETGESTTLTFSGGLSGSANNTTQPAHGGLLGDWDANVLLGGKNYTVLLDSPFVDFEYDGDPVTIFAKVFVNAPSPVTDPDDTVTVLPITYPDDKVKTTGTNPHLVPEPSTLLLGLTALGGLVPLSRIRRRRRPANEKG
jgi:hypothetical protein